MNVEEQIYIKLIRYINSMHFFIFCSLHSFFKILLSNLCEGSYTWF